MRMENPPVEDAFPIENGGFFQSHVSCLRGVIGVYFNLNIE